MVITPHPDWWPDTLPAMLHATAICDVRGAALICGPSGSGKSSLALQIMALGAGLICDDLVRIQAVEGILMAYAPSTAIAGIEARGFGILPASLAPAAPVRLVVDLSTSACARLPEPQSIVLPGQSLPIIRKIDSPAFPSIVWQYLSHI